MIRCKATGEEHRHETVAEVKACYATPKVEAKPKPQPVTEAGMYMKMIPATNGRDELICIYKVQAAVHGSGHLYAKALVLGAPGTKAKFVYAAGAIKALTADMKMTLEQAKEFGALYGTCCVCGRVLTDEGSIEQGIGPVCAKKF